MAKKHKHEEHVNHERWLVSFADMMTLLFALFVVLYAMGVSELERLKDLKKSIQFAFHIAGEGKTKDEGIFQQKSGGGEMPEPAPLITAQDGEMREFLSKTLPEEFEEVTGKSLEVKMTDDTVSFTMPLSAFFEAGRPYPVKPELQRWLGKAIVGSLTFTSQVRVRIEAPDVLIGETTDRNGIARRVTSLDLCRERLWTMRKAVVGMPEVRAWLVDIELNEQRETAGRRSSALDWEDRAKVILAFANKNKD